MSRPVGPTVGVLGLGAMGLPIARRIARAGYRVLGTDLSADRVSRAQAAGVAASVDPLTLSESQVLIVLVATPEDLASLSSNEILGESTAVELVCVMSTVGADAVIGFQQAMAARNIGVVDCPVTGGVAGAEEGTLTILAAGSVFEMQLAAEVLASVGSVKRCGERVGDGQHLKVVNQVLATSHVVVAAEALALASRLGLDPAMALELISDGAGASWMLSDRGPRMLENASTREAATHLSILAKDAHLALNAASAAGLDAVVLRAAAGQWAQAMRLGLAQQDDSSVIEIYSG
ncbi:NAD(P)-dependent oxidoreductase [Herbiconiux sp. YIM B11900]|uniref:NAD(P)-dependent oxidoreductase n=1 Tax=Herbiconiux sp. YIM B11900 TaxID=3404131 RepID=UPI003F859FB3